MLKAKEILILLEDRQVYERKTFLSKYLITYVRYKKKYLFKNFMYNTILCLIFFLLGILIGFIIR